MINEDLLFEAIHEAVQRMGVLKKRAHILTVWVQCENEYILVILDTLKLNITLSNKYESFTFTPSTLAIFDYFKLKYP